MARAYRTDYRLTGVLFFPAYLALGFLNPPGKGFGSLWANAAVVAGGKSVPADVFGMMCVQIVATIPLAGLVAWAMASICVLCGVRLDRRPDPVHVADYGDQPRPGP
jgi:hypothetical protein